MRKMNKVICVLLVACFVIMVPMKASANVENATDASMNAAIEVIRAQHEDAESCVNAKHEGRMFARFKNLDGVEHQQSPVSPLTQLPFK